MHEVDTDDVRSYGYHVCPETVHALCDALDEARTASIISDRAFHVQWDRAEAAEARIANALTVHRRREGDKWERCDLCGVPDPCPTRRSLTGDA